MESCWIINFENGYRIMLSEESYKIYDKETPKKDVRSEEHWFNIKAAMSRNPDLDFAD